MFCILLSFIFAVVGLMRLVGGADQVFLCFVTAAIFAVGNELAVIGEEMRKRRESNELVNQAYQEYLKSFQEQEEE